MLLGNANIFKCFIDAHHQESYSDKSTVIQSSAFTDWPSYKPMQGYSASRFPLVQTGMEEPLLRKNRSRQEP